MTWAATSHADKYSQARTDRLRGFRGIKGTTLLRGSALFSAAGRWGFLGQVDQILPYLFGARSAHSDQRPRQAVENKEREASDTLTFPCIPMVASGLLMRLWSHLINPWWW